MTYAEIPESLRRFLGAFEAFRKVGFPSDNLFLLVSQSARAPDHPTSAFCQLRWRGREFSVECGPLGMDAAAYGALFARVSAAVNAHAVTQADLDRIWQEWCALELPGGIVPFLHALLAKGITAPAGLS